MTLEGYTLLEAHNVKVLGSSEEVLVLAHGFGSDQSMWQNIVPPLLNSYKVILFDLAFAGTTSPDNFTSEIYDSFDGFVNSLLAILEELRIQKCVYMGHSMSAMIGCIASIRRQQLFKKLILLCGSPRYINEGDYYGGFEREDLDQLYDAMSSDFESWASGFSRLVVGVDVPDAVEKFSHTFKSMRPDIAYVVARTIFETDNRSILPQVKVPCHILQTTKDLAVPLVVGDYVKKHVGGKVTLHILPVEGHLPQMTAPHVFIQALLKVLSYE
eukprot:c27584_g1_i2 orf=477-1289(+)